MKGNLEQPLLAEIAKRYGKTPAQTALRWSVQGGVVVIPKSVHPARIAENSQIFDFALSQQEMDAIDGLNQNRRFGEDPDNVPF